MEKCAQSVLQVAFSSIGGRPMIFDIMGGLAALVVDIGSRMFKACFACGYGFVGTDCAFALRGGASFGAVPGAPGSLTPGFSGHGGTSKHLGRADIFGPCPQGHGHN